MGKKRLIYVSSPYTGAVIEGQVYGLLEYYFKQGWFEDVLLLQSFSRPEDKQKSENVLKKYNFRRKFVWQNQNYPYFRAKSLHALKKVLDGEVFDNTVFHVRGGVCASYVRSALDKRFSNLLILNEFRGFSQAELDYKRKDTLQDRLRTWVIKKHIKNQNAIMQADPRIIYTAVSPLLQRIEEQKEGFDLKKISVHPNIAGEIFKFNPQKRRAIREMLGINDNQILVVASSGQSGIWQKDLDIIDVLVQKGYLVLNLSKQEIKKEGVISLFLPHQEMPDYLSACDAAILWRDEDLLNRVACPSKFGEFAVMGLYIIHNKTVDIATQFINKTKCGQLVDNANQISLSDKLFSVEERSCRCRAGLDYFSVEQVAHDYYKILSEMNS